MPPQCRSHRSRHSCGRCCSIATAAPLRRVPRRPFPHRSCIADRPLTGLGRPRFSHPTQQAAGCGMRALPGPYGRCSRLPALGGASLLLDRACIAPIHAHCHASGVVRRRQSSTDTRTDIRSDTGETPTDTHPACAHCGGVGPNDARFRPLLHACHAPESRPRVLLFDRKRDREIAMRVRYQDRNPDCSWEILEFDCMNTGIDAGRRCRSPPSESWKVSPVGATVAGPFGFGTCSSLDLLETQEAHPPGAVQAETPSTIPRLAASVLRSTR